MSTLWPSAPDPERASGHALRAHFQYSRPSRATVLTAAVAIGALLVVKFAVAFVQLLANAVTFDPTSYANGFVDSPVGVFLGSVVLYPFFFYAAAGVALVFFAPIVKDAPLSSIMVRAVGAGALGTIVLAVIGIVTGTAASLSSGDWAQLLLFVLFIPLGSGIQWTAILVGGATLAWLWAGWQPEPVASSAAGVDEAEAAGAPTQADSSPVVPTTESGSAPGRPEQPLPMSLFAPPSDVQQNAQPDEQQSPATPAS